MPGECRSTYEQSRLSRECLPGGLNFFALAPFVSWCFIHNKTYGTLRSAGNTVKCQYKVAPSKGKKQGDPSIVGYLYDAAGPRNLIIDLKSHTTVMVAAPPTLTPLATSVPQPPRLPR